MFEWLFGNKGKKLEEETKKSFYNVKQDISKIGKWLKHLDSGDEKLSDEVSLLREDLSTINDEIEQIKEAFAMLNQSLEVKGVFKKTAVYGKQQGVVGVYKAVQTAVQTGNFYEILKGLTGSERLVVFTLANSQNSEMKLSYEDLALLLGKERATIRGQVNAIKQKSEGLIEEITEKNGKKRVFVPEEVRQKLVKYAKVRVRKGGKTEEIG